MRHVFGKCIISISPLNLKTRQRANDENFDGLLVHQIGCCRWLFLKVIILPTAV